ncbi:uncharacterized protein TrAtP1_009141 [Trichoderma atroviride]|uniref:uncharacterized protein n=1 Tax=Hypocrea atroviridis TaxID=63577 RepID=UPI0033269449|nr:hypothetical protein TrAtP1_009141 [Trichoderma atroviride]
MSNATVNGLDVAAAQSPKLNATILDRVEKSSLAVGGSITDPPIIAAFASMNGITDASQSSGSEQPSLSLPEPGVGHVQNVEGDVFIDLYYKRFHKFHPLTPPQKYFFRLWQDPSIQPRLVPLAAVLRLIGHLYRSQEWPTTLQNVIEVCFLQSSQTDPFMVQCRILYSIALFWHNYKAKACHEILEATRLAVDLGMFRREFAAKHGGTDTVLRECWRRTWWTLYIVCGYFAGTLGTMDFAVLDVEATVELPCEEAEYEMGKIPEPKTLEEFDCREFAFGNTSFSSFAYLIGAIRCTAAIAPLILNITTKDVSQQVICTADSVIDGWLFLLPTDIKQIIDKSGEIDELMFQATLVIHGNDLSA